MASNYYSTSGSTCMFLHPNERKLRIALHLWTRDANGYQPRLSRIWMDQLWSDSDWGIEQLASFGFHVFMTQYHFPRRGLKNETKTGGRRDGRESQSTESFAKVTKLRIGVRIKSKVRVTVQTRRLGSSFATCDNICCRTAPTELAAALAHRLLHWLVWWLPPSWSASFSSTGKPCKSVQTHVRLN